MADSNYPAPDLRTAQLWERSAEDLRVLRARMDVATVELAKERERAVSLKALYDEEYDRNGKLIGALDATLGRDPNADYLDNDEEYVKRVEELVSLLRRAENALLAHELKPEPCSCGACAHCEAKAFDSKTIRAELKRLAE